jgi:hypothetical protein
VDSGTIADALNAKQQEDEITTHVLVPGSGAGQEWTDQVMNLGLWLIELNTHPSIQNCILKSLMLKIPIMEIAA